MKHLLPLLFSLALPILPALAAGDNFVPNSNFSARQNRSALPYGWSSAASAGAQIALDHDVRYEGAPSMRITSQIVTSAPKWDMVSTPISGLRAKTPYTLSVMIKTADFGPQSMAYFSLNCFGGSHRLAANDCPRKVTGNHDWQRVSFTIPEIPRGTSEARFVLCLHNGGTAWYTNLQLEEGTEATPYHPSAKDTATHSMLAEHKQQAAAWLARKPFAGPLAQNGRIAVLDLNLPAGHSACGCPTPPATFASLLRDRYAVTTITAAELANPVILSPEVIDLLILPTGALFPMNAHAVLIDYLSAGGLMLTSGGYPFDQPAILENNAWVSPVGFNPPAPVAKTPVALPPAEAWIHSNDPNTTSDNTACTGPDGQPGITVSTANLAQWCNGIANLPKQLPPTYSVYSFWAKGDANTTSAWFEIDEDDGSRWHYKLTLTPDWQEFTLPSQSFTYWQDNPSIGRGGSDDNLNPQRAVRLSFGFALDITGTGMPHAVSLAGLRVGDDPHRVRRSIHPPQINTRFAPIRDAIHPAPQQINLFDPSFELRHVATTRLAAEVRGLYPELQFNAPLTGLSSIAQLGVNGHGFSAGRCVWRPLLECVDQNGRPRGHAAAIIHHFSDVFTGSSWAAFSPDNLDMFADGAPGAALLPAVVETLLRRCYLCNTTTPYACYRHGETIPLQTQVANFGPGPRQGKVRFTILSENQKTLATFDVPFDTGKNTLTNLTASWPVPADCPDFLTYTAELVLDGRTVDREANAVCVWTPSLIAKGPKLAIDGLRLTIDGQSRFFMGNQTFWGQHNSVTARSPQHFYNDYRMMRDYGLRWTRCFLTFNSEAEKRVSDAICQLAQKFGIVLYHTPNLYPTCNDKTLATQNAIMAEIATRYRDVPGLAIDIQNEPSFELTNADFQKLLGQTPCYALSDDPQAVQQTYRAATAVMRKWGATNRQAAKAVRPALPISIGWSQGWAGGNRTKDPQIASLDLDFTDRHYYGKPVGMLPEAKDVDLRVLGKPLLIGECGAKNHPTFKAADPWGHGDDDASYDYRFRHLVSHAFGMGATALLSWHWRDPMEGIFPCGLIHSTWVARPTAELYRKMASTFGQLELVDNPPDTVVLMADTPRHSANRRTATNAAHSADAVLAWLGANFSCLTETALPQLPPSVKAIIFPMSADMDAKTAELLQAFVARGGRLYLSGASEQGAKLAASPRVAYVPEILELDANNLPRLRELYARTLIDASQTRRANDPETLETYRVPGKGATGWVFWNNADTAVTTERGGHTITIDSQHAGYLQIADDGRLLVKDTF